MPRNKFIGKVNLTFFCFVSFTFYSCDTFYPQEEIHVNQDLKKLWKYSNHNVHSFLVDLNNDEIVDGNVIVDWIYFQVYENCFRYYITCTLDPLNFQGESLNNIILYEEPEESTIIKEIEDNQIVFQDNSIITYDLSNNSLKLIEEDGFTTELFQANDFEIQDAISYKEAYGKLYTRGNN